MFTVFPAIDLRNGRVVRLEEGRDDRLTSYGDDPVAVAKEFVEAGAEALHLVDLDAAFRDGNNRALVKKIVAAVDIPVQIGGGVRENHHVDELLEYGARYVIIGSAAVNNPEWIAELVKKHGDKIIVGLDAKHGEVRTHGWVEGSGVQVADLAAKMAGLGVKRIIYTDISRDGMLGGPDIDGAADLARKTGLEVVISGGVSHAEDIQKSAATGEEKVVGVIVGKAIYEGHVTVKDAVDAAKQSAEAARC